MGFLLQDLGCSLSYVDKLPVNRKKSKKVQYTQYRLTVCDVGVKRNKMWHETLQRMWHETEHNGHEI